MITMIAIYVNGGEEIGGIPDSKWKEGEAK